MRIAIFGAGAIGATYAALLHRIGVDVVLVARGAQLEAIGSKGLRIERPDETITTPPLSASDNPADLGTVDAVLLCVKAWQVEDAARAMGPLIADHTAVVTLQNGVEAHEIVARELGESHVLPGIARIIAALAEPGVVRDLGYPPQIGFAEFDGAISARAENLAGVLREAGIDCEVQADIHRKLWEKLMFITSASGVGAMTRSPMGQFLRQPEPRRMLEGVMREIYDVGAARGIRWEGDPIAATLEFMHTLPEATTTSMQRDITEGRPSELEAQTGVIVRFGRELGVPTPVSDVIYGSLIPQERRARGELEAEHAAFTTS